MNIIEISGNISGENLVSILDLYSNGFDFEVENKSTYNEAKFLIKKEVFSEKDYLMLADALLEIFIDYYMDPIIVKRLGGMYQEIEIEPTEKLIGDIKNEVRNPHLHSKEKDVIKKELADYLKEVRNINLDGYILFRFQDYVYILDIAIDNVISSLLRNSNVNEFLFMVQYLMQVQESKADILNLIIKGNDFKFRDENNEEIGRDVIDAIESQLVDIEATKADVLISCLIIMSPKKLILHYNGDENRLLIKAILEIFKNKVKICRGCSMCKLGSKLEH